MRLGRVAAHVWMLFALGIAFASSAWAAPALKGRAVWAHPADAGTTEESVRAFVEQLDRAHVNTVIMEVKTAAGLYWPSERFAEAVVPEYRKFDFPAILIREAHAKHIQVHAWFFDFAEGADSYVVRAHPEWLALSPDGKPTTAEVLRGRPYRLAWMCPARRPGYTDQWLIPLIAEFARRYDVDAIHHDYVRYPGDLAPDTYCFCDYCLRELPKYASYVSAVRPNDPLLGPMDRPHLEAHWERSPKVLPPNWDDYSREMKSRLLLEGSFFPGGNRDLDYFFYEYRAHHIAEFTRQVAIEARKARPRVEFSAAVFKNPLQSGRFIGQDWRRFSPWVQYLMPMDYRSHFAGDFETHLELLSEAIEQQKTWARDFPHVWIGVAAYQLYQEERQPLIDIRRMVAERGTLQEIRAVFDKVAVRLEELAPDLHRAIASRLDAPMERPSTSLRAFSLNEARPERASGSPSGEMAASRMADDLVAKIDAFLANPPAGYFPPEKLLRTLERVRAQDVEGIVVFSTSGLRSARLWDALGQFFGR